MDLSVVKTRLNGLKVEGYEVEKDQLIVACKKGKEFSFPYSIELEQYIIERFCENQNEEKTILRILTWLQYGIAIVMFPILVIGNTLSSGIALFTLVCSLLGTIYYKAERYDSIMEIKGKREKSNDLALLSTERQKTHSLSEKIQDLQRENEALKREIAKAEQESPISRAELERIKETLLQETMESLKTNCLPQQSTQPETGIQRTIGKYQGRL